MQINPYLLFEGQQCKEAFELYAKILGAKIVAMMTHGETPMAEHVGPDWQNAIIHARLALDGQTLMGSDCPPDRYHAPAGMSVSLIVDTPEEAERIFAAFAEGGTVDMEIQETFWAQRFGMLTDRFGIPWMVNCELPSK